MPEKKQPSQPTEAAQPIRRIAITGKDRLPYLRGLRIGDVLVQGAGDEYSEWHWDGERWRAVTIT